MTWSATDTSGNTGAAIQRITVQDTTPPAITPPPYIDVVSDVPVAVDLGTASASDIFPVTVANDAPATFPVGTTIVTWTATDASGNQAVATQTVTVNPAAPAAWLQDTGPDGLVVIDAARYDTYTPQGGHDWVPTTTAGYTGAGALKALPDACTNNNTGYLTSSPHLQYRVNFAYAGTHYVWIRGIGASTLDDSVHVGLDGQAVASADRITGFGTGWTWSSATMDGPVATIVVEQPGVHTVDIWMREDGFEFDRILLTSNGAFAPSGTGPADSPYGVPPVTVAAPVPEPAPGRYEHPVTVSLTTAAPGAAIHYTVDGTEPTTASPVYTAPLALATATRLRARAFLDGARPSPELDGTWFIKGSVFQQDPGPDGIVSIEAAHYETNTPQGGHQWVLVTPPGHVGTGAMEAKPNTGTNNNSGFVATSPRLTYLVNFNRAGIHYVWVRGVGRSHSDDSIHVGLDGALAEGADGISGFQETWGWSQHTMTGADAVIDVPSQGLHTIDVWMREDGFIWDKLIITTSAEYNPNSNGVAKAGNWGR